MSFLQPWMLFALPVIALPIAIHLINQRRFQTVPWAAMLFLLQANRMSRGYARLRQWLILAVRTLAIAGLIFAISRPLASGWLGLAGGTRVDTTLVLLDRSPSMLQRGAGGRTKLETARQRLVDSLSLLRSNHYVLIDSVDLKPVEFQSPTELLELSHAGAASASADLPAMLEVANDYIRTNRPSQSEIWICSDLHRSDWQAESGRWDAIRQSFVEMPQGVRFHLLAYDQTNDQNRSIRVSDVRRVERDGKAELLLSLRVASPAAAAAVSAGEQTLAADGPETIPIRLDLNGARTEFTAELNGGELELVDHAIPVADDQASGWGRVSIPSDANASDNQFFFVYDKPTTRRTIVVSENADASQPLELAASIAPNQSLQSTAQTIQPNQLDTVAWDEVSLLLWQAALPDREDASMVQAFLNRGGRAIFFPPRSPTGRTFAGVHWTHWSAAVDSDNASSLDAGSSSPAQDQRIASWVGDQDLLSQTRSGNALPVGELRIDRHCGFQGDTVVLATMAGGEPLLARATTEGRNVYFCGTTASTRDSSLAKDGVVLYAMVQRALADGSRSLGRTRQLIAGQGTMTDAAVKNPVNWLQLAGSPEALSIEYDVHAGVYRSDEKLFAVNRSAAEDVQAVVPAERVDRLFAGLPFDRIDDAAGSDRSLIREIWRLFLLAMMLALLAEAALCIPRRSATPAGDNAHAAFSGRAGTSASAFGGLG